MKYCWFLVAGSQKPYRSTPTEHPPRNNITVYGNWSKKSKCAACVAFPTLNQLLQFYPSSENYPVQPHTVSYNIKQTALTKPNLIFWPSLIHLTTFEYLSSPLNTPDPPWTPFTNWTNSMGLICFQISYMHIAYCIGQKDWLGQNVKCWTMNSPWFFGNICYKSKLLMDLKHIGMI